MSFDTRQYTLDRAVQMGRDAFKAGKERSANPFNSSSDCHPKWNNGWHEEADKDPRRGAQ